MDTLHYPTLSLALGLVSFSSVFVFGVLWRINREIPGLVFWFLAALLTAVGFLVLFLRDALAWPSGMATAINNIATIGALILIMEGVLRFQGLGRSRARRPWLLALGLLLVVLAVANRENPARRFLFNDALTAPLQLSIAAALVWRARGTARIIHGVAAVAYVLLALVLARRWLLAWEAPPETDLLIHPWIGVTFLVIFIHTVVWVESMNLAVNSRVQQRLRQMALHDDLTQLPNRRAYGDAVRRVEARARREKGAFGVALIDMDNFKQVNDQHGHDAGDALLQAVAQRAQAVLRGGDIICRLGGDEFVALLEDCADAVQLQQAVQRLQAALEAPLDIVPAQGRRVTLQPRASIGGALYPGDARDVDSLLQVADARMYQQKPRPVA